MKITILWGHLSSYFVEFLNQLSLHHKWRIQLVYYPPNSEAPYNNFNLRFCEEVITAPILQRVEFEKTIFQFTPSCILMCSWNYSDYMHCAKQYRKRGVPVIAAMDNQWYGTLKQRIGALLSRWLLKPYIDTFFVPGDRQAYFARKLGYEKVLYGLHPGVVDKFISDPALCDRSSSFLFVGRLTPIKGIENLVKAYRQYRTHDPTPWRLKIAGVGDLRYLVEDEEGIDYLGFVQPNDMPKVMQSAKCLILPSIREPWGVVIHEAAAAGLAIIATTACGAVTSFVRDGVNGFVIPSTAEDLADAMIKISSYSDTKIDQMRSAGIKLARMWSPESSARYFVDAVNDRITVRHRGDRS